LALTTADCLVFLMVGLLVCRLAEQMEVNWVGTMVALTEKMTVGHLACQMAALLAYCLAAPMVRMMAVSTVCLMVDSTVS